MVAGILRKPSQIGRQLAFTVIAKVPVSLRRTSLKNKDGLQKLAFEKARVQYRSIVIICVGRRRIWIQQIHP